MATTPKNRASFSAAPGALLSIPYSTTPGEVKNFDLGLSPFDTTAITSEDPPYLSSQLTSAEWIQRYGLTSQKLTFDQILQQIGYKRLESFIPSIGKSVGAKYTGNEYREVQHDNGDHYILTCRPEKLREFKNHLVRMLSLLRKRLAFITSGSRRVFGMIGEPSVCFVCDCKTTDHKRFNQFQSTVTSLLKEQVSKIKRFNIIWVSNDKEDFQERPADVTSTTIDQAIDWITARKCARNKISISATCEAMLRAFATSVHSIYLITEGESSDSAREILRDNIVKARLSLNTPIPVHVVSLFCNNNDTETFLRSIAKTTNGNFISYKIHHERTDLRLSTNVSDPTGIKFQNNTLLIGTNTATSQPEQPIDLSLMYKEINQCHSVIDRIDKILQFVQNDEEKALQKYDATKLSSKASVNTGGNNRQRSLVIQSSALFNSDESELSSSEWLKAYGIDAQKLDVASVLQPAAFRHCDGVITTLNPPPDAIGKYDKTPAYAKSKLINAKYCDQFAHITYPDGTIRHVFVTTDMHRDYERRIQALLEKIKARLSWLRKGSRDLFGTIVEKNIYILIDTSVSMKNHLEFVKDKLRLLIQDQLFSKERINMVAFNSVTNPWRDRLTKITDSKTTTQLQTWIDELYAEGSTNTLAALRFALADTVTEAIYLLTDGRPDQSERHILSQVQYRQKVPIHTIAFNCQDQIANQFLIDLSKQTGGRFHSFNYGLGDEPSREIPESEDVIKLKQELARGEKELKHVADLRDECTGRAWSLTSIEAKYKIPQLSARPVSLPMRTQSSLDTASRSKIVSSMPHRLDRRKCSSALSSRKQKPKSGAKVIERTSRIYYTPDQWLLPETEEYLRRSDKQHHPAPIVEHYETQPDKNNLSPSEPTEKMPTPYDEVKAYLKKNSLVNRGLTILDVLYPTSITIKQPAYVQVIDRHVLAKVWDDILPFTYGSHVNKLRLVNCYAVDLEKYESNLKQQISDYYKFTSRFIWDHLTDEDKRTLAPSIYWITLTDEDQKRFAQQITADEYANQTALELFAWHQLSDDKQNSFLQKTPSYGDKTQVILKNALKNTNAESALEGVVRMDTEIKRAIKFLQISTDLRQHQKRAEIESKSVVEQHPVVKVKPANHRHIGQRVLCRYDPDGYFYSGTLRSGLDGRLMVLFDMDIEQEAIGHILWPTNHSNNYSTLFLNDCVLVRQMRGDEEYWTPGLVMGLPGVFALPSNTYMIQAHDPMSKHIYAHRKDLVRITVTLYQRSILYLEHMYRRIRRRPVPVEPDILPGQTSTDSQAQETSGDLLNRLEEKIERYNEKYRRQYEELLITQEDHAGAIRILQEDVKKRSQSKIKTEPVVVPSPPSPSSKPRPSRKPKPKPEPVVVSPSPPPKSPRIENDTEVYAVWSEDDGLVYKSIVKYSVDEDHYRSVRADLDGIDSTIARNDIFLREDRVLLKDRPEKSFVFIQYPDDSRHCFCPAVIRHQKGSETTVRFYDCLETNLDSETKVIPINESQFEHYSKLRIEREIFLLNQVTVAFNNKTNTFMLGIIKKRIRLGHTYTIEWHDGHEGEQDDEFLFTGTFSRPDKHKKGDYVLAVNETNYIYEPARVISVSPDHKTLTVKYIDVQNGKEDSSRSETHVSATATFIISEDHYNRIMKLYRKK
ncbi:unnamed protein product [Adineta ricciae]|uniref:VWFA domain-containing protein n=1 Tax=Adineta ricciae TaxID=249248 RepID=A0A815KCJ4_ADIRI|nr:unnamed protein product [Adineta ricciae]